MQHAFRPVGIFFPSVNAIPPFPLSSVPDEEMSEEEWTGTQSRPPPLFLEPRRPNSHFFFLRCHPTTGGDTDGSHNLSVFAASGRSSCAALFIKGVQNPRSGTWTQAAISPSFSLSLLLLLLLRLQKESFPPSMARQKKKNHGTRKKSGEGKKERGVWYAWR